jgi:threonine aldolase
MGSCLAGTKAFVVKARWFRKIFGGGMRQTGMLAACAAYALSNNFTRLPEVHNLTRYLEKGLLDIGVAITSPADTCMVYVVTDRCICPDCLPPRSFTIRHQSA